MRKRNSPATCSWICTSNYGGFVQHAARLLQQKLKLPPGYTYQWSGEYEFEVRAQKRLELIVPIVFFIIFLLLYVIFHSAAEAAMLFFPTFFALTGGLILQLLIGYYLAWPSGWVTSTCLGSQWRPAS